LPASDFAIDSHIAGVGNETSINLLAARSGAVPLFLSNGQKVGFQEFLFKATSLAESLPDQPFAFNLCVGRYHLALSFFAALIRGHQTIFLPGYRHELLSGALNDYPDSYVVSDSGVDDALGQELQFVNVGSICSEAIVSESIDTPRLDDSMMAALVYTSGTTGASKSVEKSLRELACGAQINARYLFQLAKSPDSVNVVATVPPWHMYGFEWSILLPLFFDVTVYSGATFFPQNIVDALQVFDRDRCLLTTPHHLRALVRSDVDLSLVDNLISATAPLNDDLLDQATERALGNILEVYGSTETGSMASRDPREQPSFSFFPEFDVIRDDDKVKVWARHLPDWVGLADEMVFDESDNFVLLGRDGDLVKIAGKRASLASLNASLLALDLVEDGVFFQEAGSERLSACVVATEIDELKIRGGLAVTVERAFLPRKIIFVEALPRNETGKLNGEEFQRMLAFELCGRDGDPSESIS